MATPESESLMGHDELLARIKNELDGAEFDAMCNSGGQVEAVKALRAVVELHLQVDDNSCKHCVTWYPCETIKAIQKELN